MKFIKTLWVRMYRNDCAGLAAEIAYNWMLALVPMLIFLFSLFGMVTRQPELFNQILDNLRRIVPAEAYILVRSTLAELTRDSSGGLAAVSFLGTLWSGSNGVVVVEKALNRAYRRSGSRRGFWRQRMVSLCSAIGVGGILLVSSNLLVFGKMMITGIEHWWRPPSWILDWLQFLRWTIPISGLLIISLFVFTITPERREQRTWGTIWPGALTFVVLWICISLLFGVYVSNLSTYNTIYGPMGAIIVLMVWLYLSSYALLIGGEVNALRYKYLCHAPKPPKPKSFRRF